MALFARTDHSFLGQWWWTVDRSTLAALLILAVFGMALVSTASPPVAEHLGLGSYHFLQKHVIMLVPSLALLIGISMLDHRSIWRLATLAFVGATALIILVLLTGMEIKGARRWIHIFGFSLQPSEFIKPAFVIVSAWFMALSDPSDTREPQARSGEYTAHTAVQRKIGYAGSLALYMFTTLLLLLQPDLGMTVIVTCGWVTQVFLAGFPVRWFIILMGVGAGGLVAAYFGFDHVHSRINRFLDPESGDNFQVQKSIEAFQNGGILGTGPGQGTVKYNLPDSHADFIFSVAGEEMGFVFVSIIIIIFGFIIMRGYKRLMTGASLFSLLSAGALLTMFGLQALVHMGSALNLLPAKGMTLPFISYGGSSLLSMGISMGAVLALTRREKRSGVSKSGLSLFSR